MLVLFGYFLIRVHFSASFLSRSSLGRLPLVARSQVLSIYKKTIIIIGHFKYQLTMYKVPLTARINNDTYKHIKSVRFRSLHLIV